jgi:hypothetical protein
MRIERELREAGLNSFIGITTGTTEAKDTHLTSFSPLSLVADVSSPVVRTGLPCI